MPTPHGLKHWGQTWGPSSRKDGATATIMSGVELDWLETFLAVADRGGFTAASAQVHRSQSRVSAHIASLEREIGVRLIDRSRRPATLTEAGRVFATHAREILADVRTARSAVAAMRALSDRSVVVHTTPCIGATLLPPVLTDVLARFPDATVTLAERDWSAEASDAPDDVALVVAPADREPPPSARRQVLWWEPLSVLVSVDHELARAGAPVPLRRLVDHRLVVCTTAGRALAPTIDALAEADGRGPVRVTVDGPQTLAAMVRSGLGIGVVNASSTDLVDQAGLAVVPFDTSGQATALGFEVAADWYDVLLESPVGRALKEAVLTAALPPGAVDRRP
jgi:DNA-binding transcriptional LysR family regulator